MPKDKGYAMPKGMGNSGVMGHEKKPKPCNAFAAQKKDMGRIQRRPMDYRGTPDKAFEYKY